MKLDQSRFANRHILHPPTAGPFLMNRPSVQHIPGPSSEYVTAAEAARILKVKPQTLYTYVSRGLIRSVAQLDRKNRLYYREDVDKVRSRSDARAGSGAAAESALRWGQPVINTGITELTPDGPRYRGRLAVDLARERRSFEAVAELLWTGIDHLEPIVWDQEQLPAGFGELMDHVVLQGELPPILRIFGIATTMLGAAEAARNEIRRGTTIPAARQIMLTLGGCLGYLGPRRRFAGPRSDRSLAENIARTLLEDPAPAVIQAINTALVMCADHELSPSTFAARVAASTGAELRACMLAAVGAHSGALLGGGCDRAEELLRDARTPEDVRARLMGLEQAGSRIPGFNIVIYPKGDPRARLLLQLARALAQGERARLVYDFIDEADRRLHLRPSLEVGLVALTIALEMPAHSASALWALGRTAGWIAHVMEQRLAGFVLRPRARFTPAA